MMSERNLVDHYLELDPVERRRTFLSTREAARNIGVAQRTLQNWINEGKIDALRVGGRYVVPLARVEAFIRLAGGG